jgi:hypothetical protein
MAAVFTTQPIYESSSGRIAARIQHLDGTNITQAVVSSVVLYVRDNAVPATPIGDDPYTLTVADVIFDTLQTSDDEASWTTDDTGYDFKYDSLAAQIPDGNKSYRFEFVFTMSDSSTLIFALDVPTINLHSN